MAQAYKSAQLSYTEMFTADALIVEFDGLTFLLANKGDGKYGGGTAPNSINPIGICYVDGVNEMRIAMGLGGGDHHVVIKTKSSSIETTECFKKAVRSVSSMVLKYFNGEIQGATWQEAFNALQGGTMVFLNSLSSIFPCIYFGVEAITFGITYTDNDGVYTEFYAWNPDGTVTHDSAKYPQS